MKTKKRLVLINIFLYLLTTIFTFLFIIPLQAQEKRDHRTKKNNNVRDHRLANKASVINQTLNFDEADAIFGRRSEVKNIYPTFKITGKVDRVMITQKLSDGENSIFKTKSGNTLQATVKKGKIVEVFLKDSNGKIIDPNISPINIAHKRKAPICLNCKEVCVTAIGEDGFPVGGQECFTQCTIVECGSDDHNAVILPEIAAHRPSVGPIPIPYPNISKLDSINHF